jgi:molecular chaperone Hsp33
MSNIRKFLDANRGVRASVVNATEAVREMQAIQNTSVIATVMAGRAMAGAALMASQLKDGEVVGLYFRGDGPIEKVFAEGNFEGGVRGYVGNPGVNLPPKNNRLDLGGAIGRGTLMVMRTHPLRAQSQKGTVEIQTGEIGDDIAFYLQQSQQTRSAIAVGVKLDQTGFVTAAGGILIELLPAADGHIEVIVEDLFRQAGSISEAFARGDSTEQIVAKYLAGFNMSEVEHPYEVTYTCKCTRDRLLGALELFSEADLDDMIEKKEPVKAKCEFCGRQYAIDWTEISDVRKHRFNRGMH